MRESTGEALHSRVVMIHAVQESIPPVRQAFSDILPDAQVVNLLDEGLLIDFQSSGGLNPDLRRRMCSLIRYAEESGAAAVGLGCSVYAPVVETAIKLVNIPVISSYEAVMAEAVEHGNRVGLIATNTNTIQDARRHLIQAGQELGDQIDVHECVNEELFRVIRSEGADAYQRLLLREVDTLAPDVDAVVLAQFSMASALPYLTERASVPVLSAPHASARRIRHLLGSQT